MSEVTQLTKNKRELLEKYLKNTLQTATEPNDRITQHERGEYIPLSFGQENMWLLAQMHPNTPIYNESSTIHLPGQLNVAALEYSLNAIIARHEILRTAFPLVDGAPVQQVYPELKLTLLVIDLRRMPVAEREPEAIRIATERARPCFDLATLPLLRATLIHLDDEDHRLYITLHHIISDGTIYKIFLPELFAHYTAFLQGIPAQLPSLPIQYADFTLWQRERLQSGALNKQLDYWKKQLVNASTSLDLPTDRPRPSVQTYHGKRLYFSLSRELAENIKALARSEGVTLYMTLVTAFYVLLYRYSGQTDISIGSTTSGHTRPEVQNLLGHFVNTLVLRANLSGNPTFQELLRQVRDVVLDANTHPDIPFTYLVKELQPERDKARNPLIQVLLSLAPPQPLSNGWIITQSDVELDTTKFEIYLSLDDQPDGFDAWLEYNTDLWDEETAWRMTEHWRNLLAGAVAHPQEHIANLPMLGDEERQRVLYGWNATERSYPLEQTLDQIFAAQVQQTPDSVALLFEGQHLTYSELNQRANQLGHYLRRQGIGPEKRVALCMESSLEMVVGILGILKAGGAYVPLDPGNPEDRLTFMLADAQAPILLTQQRLLDRLPQQRPQTFCLDTDWEQLAQESTEDLVCTITSANLAYLIYTSGSTGMPKGVLGTHRATVNRFSWAWETFPFTPDDVCCQKTSLSFVDAAWEILGPLLKGCRLVLLSEVVRKSIPQLVTQLTEDHVTRIILVPSLLRALLESYENLQERLPSLRFWVSSGEALSVELTKRFHERLPDCTLLNLYGSSEVAADVTYYDTSHLTQNNISIPIGKPIANTHVYVLDTQMQPVPCGVPGELYSGGEAVARGYLGHPILTAEKFWPDPFSSKPGARMYRTGDRARYLPDGTIEYLGRIDHQVKIRGIRIEPGEIEIALAQHEAVQSAAVVVREDTQGDRRLVAFVVPKHDIANEELLRHLEKSLPAYMVPSAIFQLEAMPLTPSGKIDRKALPKAPLTDIARGQGHEYVAPTSLEHFQLLQIWEELLDARPIGIRDNFFRLGGHSLLAARLSLRIEQVFGKKIALNMLFASPTIEELANALSQDHTDREQASVTVIQIGKKQRPFFFLHGDWTGGPFYCFTLAHTFGPEQPFYAINTYNFNGPVFPLTLEDMAAAHLKALRDIQPEGPYLLGGFCNGALIAYEMARQLQAAGQETDLLLLVAPVRITWPYKAFYKFTQSLSKIMGLKKRQQLDLYLRIRHGIRHLYRHARPTNDKTQDFDKLLAIDPRLSRFSPPREALYNDYVGVFSWLSTPYTFGFSPENASFVWAEKEMDIWSDWFEIAAHKETSMLPGTHMACVTDHIGLLAALMNNSLKKAQEKQNK